MIDGKLIGKNTAEFMGTLEEIYAGDDSAEVVEVMTIAAVRTRKPLGGEDGEDPESWSFIHYRCSETAWYRHLGLAHAAALAAGDR